MSLLPNGETRVGGLRHDGSRIEYSLGFDGSGDPLVGKPVKAGVLRHDGKRFFVKVLAFRGPLGRRWTTDCRPVGT